MINPLTRKLEAFAPLPAADQTLLDELCNDARYVGRNRDLIREGDDPSDLLLILKGFACRYKLTGEGRRQITAYLVPGDVCDLRVFILRAMDHSISTLSDCQVAAIPRSRMAQIVKRPALERAFWWASVVDEAILREWLVNIGVRPAGKRIAHLLCELLVRLQTVGLADDDSYDLPITQIELADTMGLTNIHVNRVLQRLRGSGYITLKDQRLTISDVDRLMAFGDFDRRYLHLSERDGEMNPVR